MVISLPYRDDLGGVLAGAKAGRGGWPTVAGGGGEASNLGEPSCEFAGPPVTGTELMTTGAILSRAMFSYLIPLVFKYYQKPITGAEVPAIREDDGSAASLGSWRTERAANAKKRERKLVWLLLWFFRRELAQQAVRKARSRDALVDDLDLHHPLRDTRLPSASGNAVPPQVHCGPKS